MPRRGARQSRNHRRDQTQIPHMWIGSGEREFWAECDNRSTTATAGTRPTRSGLAARERDFWAAERDRDVGDSRFVHSAIRRATAWDNPAHRMDEPESPYEEWQRGRGDTGRHRPIISPATSVNSRQHLGIVGSYARNVIQQPCDRYGADVEGFQGRRFTAWDNPAHRENAAGIHTVDSDYSNPSKPNDTSDSKVIATLGPQISEVNVSSGFPKTGDNIQVVISSLGKPCCEGIVSRGPHTKCAVLNSCTDPDSLQLHKGERIDTIHGKKDEISPIVSPLKDDFHITGDDDMAKAITKVLEKNFEIDEDMHSQALLFKNLWLEAEAKLCSINYEARFERMRIQMEDIKLKAPKEDEDVADFLSCGSTGKRSRDLTEEFVRDLIEEDVSIVLNHVHQTEAVVNGCLETNRADAYQARDSTLFVIEVELPTGTCAMGVDADSQMANHGHQSEVTVDADNVVALDSELYEGVSIELPLELVADKVHSIVKALNDGAALSVSSHLSTDPSFVAIPCDGINGRDVSHSVRSPQKDPQYAETTTPSYNVLKGPHLEQQSLLTVGDRELFRFEQPLASDGRSIPPPNVVTCLDRSCRTRWRLPCSGNANSVSYIELLPQILFTPSKKTRDDPIESVAGTCIVDSKTMLEVGKSMLNFGDLSEQIDTFPIPPSLPLNLEVENILLDLLGFKPMEVSYHGDSKQRCEDLRLGCIRMGNFHNPARTLRHC
ncbi:hypothetical protein SASPL_127151 [Salvia splendens]|uniref:Uncharacterized protein n=1 Tax=Salvia splendens TaxID=180675 RepID=A0A8X8XKV9_SALSN|nr:hypothetical protein SASPL_127151 [Salvia splendens]